MLVYHDVSELDAQLRGAGQATRCAGLGDTTVNVCAAGSDGDAVDHQCALKLRGEAEPDRVPAGIDGVRGAYDQPCTGGHGNRCARHGFLGGNAGAQKKADDLALGEGFDAGAGVEHDDAIAAADEITFEQPAVIELDGIGLADGWAEN